MQLNDDAAFLVTVHGKLETWTNSVIEARAMETVPVKLPSDSGIPSPLQDPSPPTNEL